MNININKMSSTDIPFIYHVFEQNRNVLHENYISLEDWDNYFSNDDNDPHESHYIITADAVPAAWMKINEWDKPEIYISMLVVDDLFKHKGIGRAAMQFAEKEARYWGKSAVHIKTTKDNTIAAEFYIKHGYKIIRDMVLKSSSGGDMEGYEFMKIILPEALTKDSLIKVLSGMFSTQVINADFGTTQLQGGTVGDIRLIDGTAETADGDKLPYKLVLKVQKKWDRYDDPGSWRREYDFYKSNFGALFLEALRWPECYHAEMNEDETETQIWMEYIDGITGLNLTVDMYELAAKELGRFQGKLYAEQPAALKSLTNLSKIEFMKNSYMHYRSWKEVYDYIRSEDCGLPEHLRRMLIDIDENEEEIWSRIEKLPIILCHRDFWVTNILYKDDKIVLIDWDTSGWGYMGEDIASLIADEADVDHMVELYQKCVPAYYKGFSEYTDISHITDNCIRELMLIMFGYRKVECYKYAESPDEKTLQLNILQKIYEMGAADKGL